MSEPVGPPVALVELSQYLIELAGRKAYGEVVITLRAGQMVLVEHREKFKPGELPVRDRQRVELLKSRVAKI